MVLSAEDGVIMCAAQASFQLLIVLLLFPACQDYRYVPLSTPYLFIYLFIYRQGLCCFGACSGTRSIEQAVLELTEICLLVPPECWD